MLIANYFAYGSNLCQARLRRRVSGVILVSVARLDGFVLRWDKRSKDGSGKARVHRAPRGEGAVFGAVFQIPETQKPLLDQVEGLGFGYEELDVQVRAPGGFPLPAWTYIAMPDDVDNSCIPYDWYRELVVCGAQSLGLPGAYIDTLRSVSSRRDADHARDQRERAFLPCST